MNSAFTSLPLPAGALASASGQPGFFTRASRAVYRALEASGQARARRHLLDFAAQCEAQQPELAKELRAACGHDPLG